MRLYVCWGLFRTPRPGHPCRNAYDALVAAGHQPEVVRTHGWGLLPAWANRTAGRRTVRALTGSDWVPVLVRADGSFIEGSKQIVAWARDPTSPDDPDAVAGEDGVAGHDRQGIGARLSDDQTVKRIAMDER